MTTDGVSDAMTTDKELDALVEHLRRSHDCGRSNGFRCSRCESADAISALRKERDRLRGALEEIVWQRMGAATERSRRHERREG